jgi:hypothetical protein
MTVSQEKNTGKSFYPATPLKNDIVTKSDVKVNPNCLKHYICHQCIGLKLHCE